MTNHLDSLSQMSVVVADTADFALLSKWQPTDSTTNPSLILQSVTKSDNMKFVDIAVRRAIACTGNAATSRLSDVMDLALDFLLVEFGKQILARIPGRVSVEVDARLSFDARAMVKKARRLVSFFEADGIPRSRLYIKLASTWAGIKAAEVLERQHISCNLTLLFSFAQAVACAQANVSLISPFVGRILDFYKKNNPKKIVFTGETDPGVVSVRRIYAYYKRYGYKTIVMSASFRNCDEIRALAGCDKITIAPKLLEELKNSPGELVRRLSPTTTTTKENNNSENNSEINEPKWPKLTHAAFEIAHNDDPMATEKLSQGIRAFALDTVKLEALVVKRLVAIRAGRSKL